MHLFYEIKPSVQVSVQKNINTLYMKSCADLLRSHNFGWKKIKSENRKSNQY